MFDSQEVGEAVAGVTEAVAEVTEAVAGVMKAVTEVMVAVYVVEMARPCPRPQGNTHSAEFAKACF